MAFPASVQLQAARSAAAVWWPSFSSAEVMTSRIALRSRAVVGGATSTARARDPAAPPSTSMLDTIGCGRGAAASAAEARADRTAAKTGGTEETLAGVG